MTRILAMVVALLLGVAACGEDSADSDSAATGGGDQSTPTTASDGGSDGATSPTADAGDDGGDPGGSGESNATVTLDDQVYSFSTEGALVGQCRTDLFGVFSAQFPMVDGNGSINLLILHDDTDPAVVERVNAISISIGDDDWLADEASDLFGMSEALEPGMSQVDSASIEGSTVSGTATFVRRQTIFSGELETVTGSFEATCGEERIS